MASASGRGSPHHPTHRLILYTREDCPYCAKVVRYIDRIGAAVEYRDIGQEPRYRQELKQIGGKVQVPCLVIDGQPMYESDDIVRWLSNERAREARPAT
ncbi:glutaredoxin [Myxococcota bacterium]|nr:glutaredoxin [Myxococcota bacterium]